MFNLLSANPVYIRCQPFCLHFKQKHLNEKYALYFAITFDSVTSTLKLPWVKK